MSLKKRELLPKLKLIIEELAALRFDVATLELVDHNKTSLRLRRRLLEIEKGSYKDLKDEVYLIREQVNISKGRSRKKKKE